MELNGAKILYTIHTNIPLLGDFKITQTLVSTWIVMALLSGLAIWLGHFLGYVQGTGKEPKDGQPVTYESVPDFEDYGVGCFLLAGTEVYKLQ